MKKKLWISWLLIAAIFVALGSALVLEGGAGRLSGLDWHFVRTVYLNSVRSEATFYLPAALTIWLVLHVLLKKPLAARVIAQWPTAKDLRREIAYSMSSLAIFGAIGLVIVGLLLSGHAEIYRNPSKHGRWWFWLSFPALLLWQDFYFYWTHRLLHTRWLFRNVHGVHHRSRNPSPWAAYAFHPIEALVNGMPTLLALVAVPLPGVMLFAFGVHQIVRNALGHAAVEILPSGFTGNALGDRFTTTTHHHLHHEYASGNYGLWFTWWDRIGGTERVDYKARFAQVSRGSGKTLPVNVTVQV